MRRIVVQALAVVVFVGLGWYAGSRQGRHESSSIFRLRIDAPLGETAIRCEGCQFFSWPGGRAQLNRSVTVTCDGTVATCSRVIGAMVMPDELQQIARR
jgi:hypothetical protein